MGSTRACSVFSVALAALVASTCFVHARRRHWSDVPNFIRSRLLTDGERERRLHWNAISAIETAVEFPRDESGPRQGLVLRQVTDGRHFIQLIYDSGWELRDCEYLRDARSVQNFLDKLDEDFRCAKFSHDPSACVSGGHEGGNDTFSVIPDYNDTVLAGFEALLDYRSLKQQCRDLHQRIRDAVRHRPHSSRREDEEHRHFLERMKRDLFLYPGTNWCGSGSNARQFNELGYNAAADRCCRDHDHCPYTIESFTTKYDLFNYRFHTLSHCECDERFRSCLKLANTAAANMVGKLFFNVVQTKCFLFKKEQVCVRRSWWGKCIKFDWQKQAHLRDGLPY